MERNGKIYKGLWSASKVDESHKIAKAYGGGYQNHQRGLGSYLRQGYSTFQSEQGDTLYCEFTYKNVSAKVSCKSDSEYFEFLAES